MNDRHILRFINDVGSYLSLLNHHLSDLNGVTDEAIINEHFDEISSLIDAQDEVLDDLNMFIEVKESELSYYNDAYRDLVARRRSEGAEAINDDPYTSGILENYKKVPELEQVLKVVRDYRDTIARERDNWNANKSIDTLRSVIETTNEAFEEMNAARERYGYVAVEIKDEGQFRKVNVHSQGKKVSVNVPPQQFNGSTVSRVIEGAMAAADAKNDPIVTMQLPNGEVVTGKISELSSLAVKRMDEIAKEEAKKPKEEAAPVVEATPTEVPTEAPEPEKKDAEAVVTPVTPPVPPIPPVGGSKPTEEKSELDRIVDEVKGFEDKPSDMTAEEILTEEKKKSLVGDAEPVTEEKSEVVVAAPVVEGAPAEAPAPETAAPEGEKKETPVEEAVVTPAPEGDKPETGDTPAEGEKTEEEKKGDSERFAEGVPVIDTEEAHHDRAEDVAGDNIVEIGAEEEEKKEETPVPAGIDRNKKYKVVSAKKSKFKHNLPYYVSGIAAIGFAAYMVDGIALACAGFFIAYGLYNGLKPVVEKFRKNKAAEKGTPVEEVERSSERKIDFDPVAVLQQWAVSRKIRKVVKDYEDLDFVIDERGPRIEDYSAEGPTPEEEAFINKELAKAVRDKEANWKDIPSIYRRKELDVPTSKSDSFLYKFADKFKEFFGTKEEVEEAEVESVVEPVVESAPVVEATPAPVTPVVPVEAPTPVATPVAAPVVESAPVREVPAAPVIDEGTPIAPAAPATPVPAPAAPTSEVVRKKSFGDKLKGLFGKRKKDEEAVVTPVVTSVAPAPAPAPAPVVTAAPVEDPVLTRPFEGISPAEERVPEMPESEMADYRRSFDEVYAEAHAEPSFAESVVAAGGRNYPDDKLLKLVEIANRVEDINAAKAEITALFGGLDPVNASMTTGFTPADMEFVLSHMTDEIKFQDLQEMINSTGYLIDEPEVIERGVSRI